MPTFPQRFSISKRLRCTRHEDEMLWHKVERAVQCAGTGIDGQDKVHSIDVRVPGTVYPVQKVCVNACANDAQNQLQSRSQRCRESAMSGAKTIGVERLEDTNVASTARSNSERKPQLFTERTWAVVLCSKYVPCGTDTHISNTFAHMLRHGSTRSTLWFRVQWDECLRTKFSRSSQRCWTKSATWYAGNPDRG